MRREDVMLEGTAGSITAFFPRAQLDGEWLADF
jgi:hypothetical protein